MTGGAGTGGSTTNPHATATTGSQLSSTATTGTNANANTYQRLTTKPNTTSSAIGQNGQVNVPNKVQPNGNTTSNNFQTGSATIQQNQFTVKMSHHKKASHRKAKQNPSLKSGLKYLKKYSHHSNHKYPRFSNDCTSFASQYMRARGYHETSKGKEHIKLHSTVCYSSKKWYFYVKKHKVLFSNYQRIHHTTSWSTVNGFWKFWVGHGKLSHFTTSNMKKVQKKAKLGDIIQFKDKRAGWFHTAIVSKKNKHGVYYASHTKNFFRKPLKKCNQGRHGSSRIIDFRVIHLQKKKL
ncbi:amidase domain-containing protein [Secundilactobacillus kimchicus]|uniref:amidase domain-containing protein n=1 Tax=Secundilactobacillus kimchicus TaxID=528209 RepID=UPI0024A7AD52|nr:amidase domain-containing protein [Secundilactobacillus kimchicus]